MSNYNPIEELIPKEFLQNIIIHQPIISNSVKTIKVEATTIKNLNRFCPRCNTNTKHHIKDKANHHLKAGTFNHALVYLKIKKYRYVCTICGKTHTEDVKGIKPRSKVTEKAKLNVKQLFITAKTNKDVAIMSHLSQSTVSRIIIDNCDSKIKSINYNYLPPILGMDEFKSGVKNRETAFAFLLLDHEKKKPYAILDSRKSLNLDKFFSKFSQKALDSVKIVTMDMYDTYINTVKKYFKNAEIVLDKFHIVQNFTRALNKTRIKYMNTLSTDSIEYKRLKKYWKSILSFKIEASNTYIDMPLYDHKTNISDVVYDIVSKDKTLYNSYSFYQIFFYHLNNKNFDAALNLIEKFIDKVSPEIKTSMETFVKYKDISIKAYCCSYSNAITESVIQKIKLIKRNAFGFKDFKTFHRRICYYFDMRSTRNNLLKLPNTTSLITSF